MLRYLKHPDIDPAKWDACIERAPNGLIYAYSFYLDHMARHWDALVLGDYEAVMPLTWNKKFGISYLYQPPFVACGGVFGSNFEVGDFINAIPKKFRLIEINLNAGNTYTPGQLRNNFVLPLNAPYEEIYSNYRDNIKRNIKKAISAGCVAKTGVPVEQIISLAKQQLSTVVRLREQDLQQFQKLCEVLKAVTYGVFSSSGQLLASCIYFFSHNRAYYILVGNHPNGKTLGASHYLIDRFIADHAGSGLLLDFEGSDIRNLAFFYSSFGATVETYPAVRVNRLPWYVNMFR
jgi:hypothetical protein